MSAQTISETAIAPIWSGWQSTVINGLYPLQRFLSGTDRSAVFLTERTGEVLANAAVKIIPVEQVTLSQLSHWRLATGLSHPHLIQLFDAGLCHFGGRQFLFVVMEYADQTLSQFLSQRALTPEEVREMLPATLEALTFLHGKGLVQGQLKPSNILVVGDQLKLASDSIRPVGAPRAGIAELSAYDPPEAGHAAASAADDLWGLGMTLVEALTQSLPWRDERLETVRLPITIPPEFLDTLQRCLSYNPAGRPLATELEAQLGGAPKPPPAPVPHAAVPEASQPLATDLEAQLEDAPKPPLAPVPHATVPEASPPAAPIPESPRQRGLVLRLAIIGSLIVLAAVWAGWQRFRTHSNAQQSTVVTGQMASQQAAAVPASASPTSPAHPATTAPPENHVQLPNVPRKALATIHGHFKIAVLVVVDHSGTVIRALLKNTGPSPYFARLALEAAMKSRFAPADRPGTRKWQLHFEFTRSGVTGEASPES